MGHSSYSKMAAVVAWQQQQRGGAAGQGAQLGLEVSSSRQRAGGRAGGRADESLGGWVIGRLLDGWQVLGLRCVGGGEGESSGGGKEEALMVFAELRLGEQQQHGRGRLTHSRTD